MTSYLASGWFQQDGKKSLRTEVIDGAMDVAGMLARADVPAHVLMRVALRVRALVAIADPQMVSIGRFSGKERSRIEERLERYTDTSPELHAFVADCLERVDNVSDLMAFYLHLIHVARMMQLIDVALHDTVMAQVRDSLLGEAPPPTGALEPTRTPPAKRKAAKKSTTGKKKASKKKTATKKKTAGRKKTAKKTTTGKKKVAKKKTAGRKKPAKKTTATKKATQKKTAGKKKAAKKKTVGKKKTAKKKTARKTR